MLLFKISTEYSNTESIIPTAIEEIHTTNIICQYPRSTANLLVNGVLPYWVMDEFGGQGYNVQRDTNGNNSWLIKPQNQTSSKIRGRTTKGKKMISEDTAIFVSEFNALPVSGFGPDLDIGVYFEDNNTDNKSTLREDDPYQLTRRFAVLLGY